MDDDGAAVRPAGALSLRVRFGPGRADALGPGKIALLEHIRETGSIAGAARAMHMAYRRAWLLVDSLNNCFDEPLVATTKGGPARGGAVLTPLGEQVVRLYRRMENGAARAVAGELAVLQARLRPRAS